MIFNLLKRGHDVKKSRFPLHLSRHRRVTGLMRFVEIWATAKLLFTSGAQTQWLRPNRVEKSQSAWEREQQAQALSRLLELVQSHDTGRPLKKA
jgi:hypothetical protein